MRRARIGWLLVILLAIPARWAAGADSLQSVRDEARIAKPDPPEEEKPASSKLQKSKKKDNDNGWNYGNSSQSHHCDDDDTDDSGLYAAAFGMAAIAVTSPFWAPHRLIEGDEADDGLFAAAPYYDSPGSMLFGRALDEPFAEGYRWATKLRTECLDDFDSLTGYRGHVLVEHANRVGFDSELNYWRQSLSPGVFDHLWTGDANVVFRFAQNERVQMRTGLGVAWLSDPIDTNFGFNFTYGGDIYPIKPLVISAELDAGWVGEAWMVHLRGTVGVVWRQAEVYTGYDYLEIGRAQLDGWVAGVRVLF
jgi:hypothetical protein